MRLLIDAGNTRLKWRLEQGGIIAREGSALLDSANPLAHIEGSLNSVSRVAVSTVIHEDARQRLLSYLMQRVPGPVNFYWAEGQRCGLLNSYEDVKTMGSDRWHGMYGAWRHYRCGCAVIDAGSAITVDYVSKEGKHLGGYILPGLQMMLRSLRSDAARIAFEPAHVSRVEPGNNTAECVNQGLSWLSQAMIDRIRSDASEFELPQTLVTGGDAERLFTLGVDGVHHPSLVLDGLGYIDNEAHGE